MARSNVQRGRMSLLLALSVFLGQRVTDFAARAPQSRAPQMGMTPRPGSQLPREVLELKDPEPEPEVVKVELPERRVPYTMSCYVHSDGPRHEENSPASINFKYMVKKIKAALSAMEDWIMSVDVRMNIQPHQHAYNKVRGGSVDTVAERADTEEVIMVSGDASQVGVRELAPYRMEVTVRLGKDTIVVSGDKHAKASFTEAVDHVHDILRNTMTKEREKRIKMMRRARDTNSEAVSDNAADYDEENTEVAQMDTPELVEEESQGAYELVDFEAVEKEEAEEAAVAAASADADDTAAASEADVPAPAAVPPADTQANKSSGSDTGGGLRDVLLR